MTWIVNISTRTHIMRKPIFQIRNKIRFLQRKEEGKDQESIQSRTTPDPGTIWESDKNTRKHHIQHVQESQHGSSFPAGDHKAAMNRKGHMTKTNTQNTNNKRDQQKKLRLGTVSKKITRGLKHVSRYQPRP